MNCSNDVEDEKGEIIDEGEDDGDLDLGDNNVDGGNLVIENEIDECFNIALSILNSQDSIVLLFCDDIETRFL